MDENRTKLDLEEGIWTIDSLKYQNAQNERSVSELEKCCCPPGLRIAMVSEPLKFRDHSPQQAENNVGTSNVNFSKHCLQ